MLETLFIVLVGKFIFLIFMWFTFFLAEKVTLDAFVTRVYLADKKPPNLLVHMAVVFAALLPFTGIICLGAYLILARWSSDKPVVAGARVIKLLFVDLIVAWAFSFAVSLVVAHVTQSRSCLRYTDDGLRGIRACYLLAFVLSAIVSMPPYFLAV